MADNRSLLQKLEEKELSLFCEGKGDITKVARIGKVSKTATVGKKYYSPQAIANAKSIAGGDSEHKATTVDVEGKYSTPREKASKEDTLKIMGADSPIKSTNVDVEGRYSPIKSNVGKEKPTMDSLISKMRANLSAKTTPKEDSPSTPSAPAPALKPTSGAVSTKGFSNISKDQYKIHTTLSSGGYKMRGGKRFSPEAFSNMKAKWQETGKNIASKVQSTPKATSSPSSTTTPTASTSTKPSGPDYDTPAYLRQGKSKASATSNVSGTSQDTFKKASTYNPKDQNVAKRDMSHMKGLSGKLHLLRNPLTKISKFINGFGSGEKKKLSNTPQNPIPPKESSNHKSSHIIPEYEPPKKETPKQETAKVEPPKGETPKAETPKADNASVTTKGQWGTSTTIPHYGHSDMGTFNIDSPKGYKPPREPKEPKPPKEPKTSAASKQKNKEEVDYGAVLDKVYQQQKDKAGEGEEVTYPGTNTKNEKPQIGFASEVIHRAKVGDPLRLISRVHRLKSYGSEALKSPKLNPELKGKGF